LIVSIVLALYDCMRPCIQVRIKYSEQYEYEQISNLLGMDKKDGFSIQQGNKEVASFIPSLLV